MVDKYGTVQITVPGGDTLHAAQMGSRPLDWRDNTFVRVSEHT
jgi:hypothetical protein